MVKSIFRLACVGLLWVASGVAIAVPVSGGVWYQFAFDTIPVPPSPGSPPGTPPGAPPGVTGCPAADFDCASISGTTFVGAPPWTISIGSLGAKLKVTDGFLAGDVFEIFVNGSSAGATDQVSPVLLPVGCNPLSDPTVSTDPDPCFGGLASKYGEFDLGAGFNSFYFTVKSSQAGYGSAFFRIDGDIQSVPTPGTFALTLLALSGLGFSQLRPGRRTNRHHATLNQA